MSDSTETQQNAEKDSFNRVLELVECLEKGGEKLSDSALALDKRAALEQ
jgi:hypothetical protein